MARLDEVKRLQKIAGILKENVNEGPLGKLGNLTDEQEVELAKKAAEEVFRNWKKITGYTDPNDPKSDPVKYSKLTDVGVRAHGEDWDYPKGVYNFLKQKPYSYVDIGYFNGEFDNLLDAAEDAQGQTPWDKLNKHAKDTYGEFGFATCELADKAEMINLSLANQIAKKKYSGDFSSIKEEEMEEIINSNPQLVKI